MKLIDKDHTLSSKELAQYKLERGELVKAVVDVEQKIMIIGVDLHVDAEQELLDNHDSKQSDVWGINLYPSLFGQSGFLEFDSMINLRPRDNNKSRGVDDPILRKRISKIVSFLITA